MSTSPVHLVPLGPDVDACIDDAITMLTVAPERARRVAEAMLTAAPKHPRATRVLAEALARLGELERAEVLFRRATRGDGVSRAGRSRLGRVGAVDCPLCGAQGAVPVWVGDLSRDHELQGHIDPIRAWVRCVGCGLARVGQPVPAADLAAWRAPGEGSPPAPPNAGWIARRLMHHEGLITRIRDVDYGVAWTRRSGMPRPRLLEVGCGWGDFLAAAEWRGFEAVGLSADEVRSAWARASLGAQVEPLSDPVVVPQGCFDVVVLREGLDGIPDPIGVLGALGAGMADGGLLVMSVALLDHPVRQLRGYDDPLWTQPQRRVCFDRQRLALTLLHVGFQPEGTWHEAERPGWVQVIARWARPD